jgi:hypothetical protein
LNLAAVKASKYRAKVVKVKFSVRFFCLSLIYIPIYSLRRKIPQQFCRIWTLVRCLSEYQYTACKIVKENMRIFYNGRDKYMNLVRKHCARVAWNDLDVWSHLFR